MNVLYNVCQNEFILCFPNHMSVLHDACQNEFLHTLQNLEGVFKMNFERLCDCMCLRAQSLGTLSHQQKEHIKTYILIRYFIYIQYVDVVFCLIQKDPSSWMMIPVESYKRENL